MKLLNIKIQFTILLILPCLLKAQFIQQPPKCQNKREFYIFNKYIIVETTTESCILKGSVFPAEIITTLNYDLLIAVCRFTAEEQLNFSDSQITEIEGDGFNACTHLKGLSLNKNILKILEDYSFGSLELLEKLDLSDNFLKHLSEYCFHGLRELNELLLHRNELTIIPPEVFNDQIKLKIITLYSNRILRIDYNILISKLPELKKIYLGNNPLVCANTSLIREVLKEKLIIEVPVDDDSCLNQKYETTCLNDKIGSKDCCKSCREPTQFNKSNACNSISSVFIIVLNIISIVVICN